MNNELEKNGLRSILNSIKFFIDKKDKNDILCKDCSKKYERGGCKYCIVDEESLRFESLIHKELENYYDITVDYITGEKNEKFWE